MINDYPVITIGWNIFLLLLPYFFCRLIIAVHNSHLPAYYKYPLNGIVGFFWLIFMPNTAYVMSDVRHLNEFCPGSANNVCQDNAWQIMVFFAYGAIGWVSYVYLLEQMAKFITNSIGENAKRWFIALVIPLIALGVLLGLLDRWNSWEIFFHPGQILVSFLSFILVPVRFYTCLIYTAFLYLLYFSGRRIFSPGRL
ncbi:MAG: DUF1361 domain-containing protein [Planctomycetes bacterium]|jgi:uncharacterized membrane protein|nr:DUF1361 domain-containing protein [Planctomycetota bacterium]